jgi:hypothetical protein
MRKKNERIEERVEKYGYTQREAADHLGMRFTLYKQDHARKEMDANKIDLILFRYSGTNLLNIKSFCCFGELLLLKRIYYEPMY